MRIPSLALLLTACATTTSSTPKGGPRGLRANEHLEMARHHDQLASQASRIPDPFERGVMVPWTWSWDSIADHERLAMIHRSRAAALQAAYEEACVDRPLAEVMVSPLARYAIGSWNTASGVTLYLSTDAGPAQRLLADLRCHRAWMMLQPVADMDDCPLDLPGIQLDARGDRDAITVSIAVRDPKLVEELQRRAAHDVETGAQLRKPWRAGAERR